MQFLFELVQCTVIDCNLIIYISHPNSKNNLILQSLNEWIVESLCSVSLGTQQLFFLYFGLVCIIEFPLTRAVIFNRDNFDFFIPNQETPDNV